MFFFCSLHKDHRQRVSVTKKLKKWKEKQKATMKQEKKKKLKLFYAEVSKGQTSGQIDNPECDQYSEVSR